MLIPALVLVCLYPQMEASMLERKEKLLANWEKNKTEYEESTTELIEIPEAVPSEKTFYLNDNFVNYVVEASYYQYASFLRNASGQDIYTDILDDYGWINDYYTIRESTPYYVEYDHQANEEASKLFSEESLVYDISSEEIANLLHGEEISEPRKTQLKASGLLGYLTIEYDNFGKISNIQMKLDDNVNYDNNVYRIAKDIMSHLQ